MNFYNENDPKTAAWLRELIKAGLIAPGIVDERSIVDVQPSDLDGFNQCHFFAGIGGWSYALRLAGWPDDRPVWTASLPCQPFSTAGKRKGACDDRHLWPVFSGLLEKHHPNTVFGEQVARAIGFNWLDGVSADLEAQGYAVGQAVLGAHSAGAPHGRQRLYWLAHAKGCNRRLPILEGRSHEEGPKPERCSETCHLANPQRGGIRGCGPRANEGAETGVQREDGERQWVRADARTGNGSMVVGLGDSNDTTEERFRPVGIPLESEQEAGRSSLTNAWSDFEFVGCADGKARRIERGTFPLANGFPGRVGLLRGYGNAIVPQVAAEFIQACVEATEETPRA